jgi:two-component system, NtrC family, sensor histidine kinase HydH
MAGWVTTFSRAIAAGCGREVDSTRLAAGRPPGMPKWAFEDHDRLNWWEDARWRLTLILGGALLLSLAHWLTPASKSVHNALFHLDVIPILAAGVLHGWRAAALVTVLIGAAELPQVWLKWPHDAVYFWDQVGELSVFGAAGIVVGYLSERQRRQRGELEKTTLELESVYTELRENVERLKKAERLSAVAQLSASLAHEIRNPLAGISGAAGILRRGHASPGNVRECVEIIEKESARLNQLLTGFLEFARPRPPRFQPTDLSAVLDSVVAVARHSRYAAEIELRCEIAGEAPELECDSEQLKQVLLNLVINAMEATGRGVVELQARAEDGHIAIVVRDHGAGIPPEYRALIFEPFFTTKDHGTGLGLAIAAKIVEQHGGSLIAADAPGGGAEMIMHIPIRHPREATA